MQKNKVANATHIKKVAAPDIELKFSFKFFDPSDSDLCPATFTDGYTQALMQRMRDLSSWTVKTFTTKQDKSVRNHTHEWNKTGRPDGFSCLNDHYKDYPGWQFCISANEHGRVHGIIIDDTFHVIWLDKDHRLYPA